MPNTIGLPLFEIASMLVRLNHLTCFIVNANHSIARAAETAGL